MSRIAYAALGRPGSFARDGRYAKPQVPEEPVETEDVAERPIALAMKMASCPPGPISMPS